MIKKKKILQDLDGDDLPPSPMLDDDMPTSQYSTRTRAWLKPNPGPGEVHAAAAAPRAALPEIVEPPFRQAPIPEMETSGQHPHLSRIS